MRWLVAFLIDFKAHMKILFIVKVKTLEFINRSYTPLNNNNNNSNNVDYRAYNDYHILST